MKLSYHQLKQAIGQFFHWGKNSPATSMTEEQWRERSTELERSLALTKATLESTADGILVVNKAGKIVDCNRKFVMMWRIPQSIMETRDDRAALEHVLGQVKDPDSLYKEVTGLYNSPEEKGDLKELQFKDGRVFERYSQPFYIGGSIEGRVWSFRDITERRNIEEALRLRERAIESSANGVMIIDITQPDLPIIYVNPAFEKITGYKLADVIGRNARLLQGEDRDQPSLRRLQIAVSKKQEELAVLRNYRRDGSLFWNELHISPVREPDGEVKYYVGILNDITSAKKLEEQLLYQATHDTLTELPNRSLLFDRIQQAIIHSSHSKSMVAILFIDLDRFKIVNDSMGHPFGDLLLKQVGERLMSGVRDIDTVARMGGDEFIVVMPSVTEEKDGFDTARKLLEAIRKPFLVANNEVTVTASIGLCFYPKDASDVDSLIKGADMSMYLAKDRGKNNFQCYTDELDRQVTKRMDLENKIRTALEKNELMMYYQPLYCIKNNHIIGMEALLRWKHPELGLVPPCEFIPIIEENGMIIPIGKWILTTTCKQLVEWHKQGFKNLTMAVNVSGRQLNQPDIVDVVAQVIHETGVDPACLELELTESMLLDHAEDHIEKLHSLKALGVKLAIDDFGTGYSSLNYLKRFPIDKLKIDISFIRDVTVNPNNAAITTAIINLAKTLHLSVLAEGIETEAQNKFLLDHACDNGQGYLFKPPVPAEQLTQFLQKSYVDDSVDVRETS